MARGTRRSGEDLSGVGGIEVVKVSHVHGTFTYMELSRRQWCFGYPNLFVNLFVDDRAPSTSCHARRGLRLRSHVDVVRWK